MSDNQLAVFSKPADLMAYLQRSRAAIEMALPKHLNPDRMLRLALTSFSTTPALRQCSGQSILSSIVVASQIGLEPGVAGQGYLIPYKQTCTFVPGWQGLVGLLNNSGRATAWTGAVFEGDVFDFQLGSAPRCAHIPGPNFGDPEKMTWVYACGKVNGSEQPVIEAWPIARVWKHRDRFNKVGGAHYSFKHPEMYARKVVLLQVLKYMPRSIEVNNALTAANAAEIGAGTTVEGGVVIEIPAPDEIPSGRVGKPAAQKSISEMAAEEASGATAETTASETAPATESKPSAPKAPEADSGPSADSLRKTLLSKCAALNVGRVKLARTICALKLAPEGTALEAMDAKTLAAAVDSWDGEGGLEDTIRNPEA